MTWELSDCTRLFSALLSLAFRSANQIWASHVTHLVILHDFVVDWLRQAATPSGRTARQPYCMEIWFTSYNVVNWNFPGISLTSIDHHASLSAPFRVLLTSTPPFLIQGTRTSFRLEKCGLGAKLSRSAWSLLELHPGGLLSDNRLKSYIYTTWTWMFRNPGRVLTCGKVRHLHSHL